MSIVDEFDEVARASTLGSGDRLRSLGDSLGARVRSSRRRRDVGMGAGTAMAIGAVVAGALVLPRAAGTHPAGTPSPTQTSLDVPTMGQISCGEPLDLTQPVTIFDDSVQARSPHVSANLENVDGTIIAGSRRAVWHVSAQVGGDGPALQWSATTVVVHDGVIVGTGEGVTGLAGASGGSTQLIPAVPGDCAVATAAPDARYTSVAVLQMRNLATGEPVATYLFSEEVNFSGVIPYNTRGGQLPDGATHLLAPYGDSYQAFVHAAPVESSCSPYQDLIAAGEPGPDSITYDVWLPGVQPLSAQMWTDAPIAIVEQDHSAWYVNRPTAITSAKFGEGDPLNVLEWASAGSSYAAVPDGQMQLMGTFMADQVTTVTAGCAYTLPGPTPSGSVFLIIDDIDAAHLSQLYPTANFASSGRLQTWVYLGSM